MPTDILIGHRIERLEVIGHVAGDDGRLALLCRCDCGATKRVRPNNWRQGRTRSCGCLRREIAATRNYIHGHARDAAETPTYHSWSAMHERCRRHPRYAGRVVVSERWDSFENFLADMGERPEGLTLDRIDNDGNYEPSNCRWATDSEQNLNRRPFARPPHSAETRAKISAARQVRLLDHG